LCIHYASTCSYGDIAKRIGNPGASRAVGAANGANPIPIIIPCHRVIGASGKLTGFGGGLPTKQWLLVHEKGEGQLFGIEPTNPEYDQRSRV
jgi:methylated-DNA-[protein]-cysteine S-methyltransferase